MNITNEKEHRKTLLRLLTYTKPHLRTLTLAFGLLTLTTLAEIIGPILVKIFIDDYLTPGYLPFKPLLILGSVYLSIQIGGAVLTYFQSLTFQTVALKIIQQLRIDVFSKVQTLGMRFFDRTPAGAIVSRATNDTEAIKELFVDVLVTMIRSSFLLVGIFIAMFILNVKLALFCLVVLPILLVIVRTYRKHSTVFYQNMREQLSRINAKLNESISGMAIIQLFRQEKRLREEFAVINNKHYEAGMKNIKIDSLLLRPAIDLVYILAIIIVLSYFGITSLSSPIEIGVLYAFVNYIERFFKPINQMMQRLTMYQQAMVAGTRVFELLDEKEVNPHQLENSKEMIENGDITFENVSFSYDGKQDVLKNISFTAKRGETVALVGHTGSGKSSIINLLMRFYEFDRGDIRIDGVSIKDINKNELRKKLGLVLQDPFLFYGTVKDNIRLYDEALSDAEVRAAAEFVQADEFISTLDGGYEHLVVERGATFSSGQRQLIAFARTIAANPRILVLDEATANIDTETEEAIQVALQKMRKGRTTIAIAHRLSTIQDADQILVLHQGEIVERGTHQQLLAKQGLYYKMYLLQNGLVERMAGIVAGQGS